MEPIDNRVGDDFARIVPVTPLAQQSFSEVVAAIGSNDDKMKHAKKFIVVDQASKSGDGDENSDEAEAEAEAGPRRAPSVCGHYRLNFNIKPNNPRLGWVIGRWRPGLASTDVDILLTANPGQHRVRGRHARLSHAVETGVLMIFAHSWPVVLDGKDVLRDAARAICSRVGLCFGDLVYVLEFNAMLDPIVLQSQISSFYSHLAAPPPATGQMPLLLTPSPTPTLRVSAEDKYYISPVHAGGVSSSVSHAFVKATGEAVAIKRMKRVTSNAEAIQNEVRILNLLHHPNVCRLVEAIGYKRDEPFRHNECDEVLLVLSPFAPPLSNDVGRHRDGRWMVHVFKQCFAALDYLHQRPLMHRDIKLDNIGIIRTDPPQAYILDFGHATTAQSSDNHHRGTLRYLAPEVVALKEGKSVSPYDNKVDIWALGICIYECLVGSFVHWQMIRRTDSDKIWAEIRSLRDTNSEDEEILLLINLLRLTLVWEPSLRPPAAEAIRVIGHDHEALGRTASGSSPRKRPHWA